MSMMAGSGRSTAHGADGKVEDGYISSPGPRIVSHTLARLKGIHLELLELYTSQ